MYLVPIWCFKQMLKTPKGVSVMNRLTEEDRNSSDRWVALAGHPLTEECFQNTGSTHFHGLQLIVLFFLHQPMILLECVFEGCIHLCVFQFEKQGFGTPVPDPESPFSRNHRRSRSFGGIMKVRALTHCDYILLKSGFV